jgi:hypothetical protein
MQSDQGEQQKKVGCYWFWNGKTCPSSGISCYAGVNCKFDHSLPPTKEEIENFEKPKTIAIISHFAQVSRDQWNDPSSIKSLPLKAAVLSCQTDTCKCGLATVIKETGAMRLDMPTLVTMGINKRKAVILKEASSSSSSSGTYPKAVPKAKAMHVLSALRAKAKAKAKTR